jgi:riboflavin synthase
MFTGIIEGIGVISSIQRNEDDFAINVETGSNVSDPQIGESVALDGVCLTVVKAAGSLLTFDLSVETINRTSFKTAKQGDRLNLERALKLGDRLGGHIVSGHVDCVGALVRVTPSGEGYEIEVELPDEGMKYIIEKGSIAISGISLTVAAKLERSVTVAIIPHTFEVTSLKGLKPGSTVNIEYDMMAKYVENIVKPYIDTGGGKIDKDFLSKHGF